MKIPRFGKGKETMSTKILIDGQEVGGVVKYDIVERPTIVDKHGKITLATPEMEKLPVDQLKLLAKLADGKLVYRKFEVTYKEIKGKTFCDWKDCYALADDGFDGYCYKHGPLAQKG